MPSGLDSCGGHASAAADYADGVYHYHVSATDAPNVPNHASSAPRHAALHAFPDKTLSSPAGRAVDPDASPTTPLAAVEVVVAGSLVTVHCRRHAGRTPPRARTRHQSPDRRPTERYQALVADHLRRTLRLTADGMPLGGRQHRARLGGHRSDAGSSPNCPSAPRPDRHGRKLRRRRGPADGRPGVRSNGETTRAYLDADGWTASVRAERFRPEPPASGTPSTWRSTWPGSCPSRSDHAPAAPVALTLHPGSPLPRFPCRLPPRVPHPLRSSLPSPSCCWGFARRVRLVARHLPTTTASTNRIVSIDQAVDLTNVRPSDRPRDPRSPRGQPSGTTGPRRAGSTGGLPGQGRGDQDARARRSTADRGICHRRRSSRTVEWRASAPPHRPAADAGGSAGRPTARPHDPDVCAS